MSKEEEIERQRRRRRSRTYGFFDHGDRDLYPRRVHFADEKEEHVRIGAWIRYIAEMSIPAIRSVISLALGILATGAIVGSLIILASTSVRGMSMLCSHHVLPESSSICRNAWVKPQESILSNLKEDNTPLTGTLYELSELTKMTASLDFIGLAMHIVSQNLTTAFEDFKQNKDAVDMKGDKTFLRLAHTASHTQKLLDALTDQDAAYRHEVVLYEEHGIADLSDTFNQTRRVLNNSTSIGIAALQIALHTIPYGSQSSLSYNILQQYHHFFQAQEENTKIAVFLTTESKLSIQEMIANLSQLHHLLTNLSNDRQNLCPHHQSSSAALCKFNPAPHSENLETQLTALTWLHDVVKIAELRYKNLYSEIFKYRVALQEEVQGYERWWMANRRIMSLRKLKQILAMEERQIQGFMALVFERRGVVEKVYEDMMSGDQEGYDATKWRLEAAMQAKKFDWL
ncbi:hypothetical protein AC578_2511 [Pseudocercospora eumusae]|uniref:Uncharacterized protein n=1 Tax=Pseudocercospora eumusae TaxID=321146 RepID=A0A139GX94_9PEZI|nr:hypothetical protein AC578_2511 [Pseudocercospora eumusae]